MPGPASLLAACVVFALSPAVALAHAHLAGSKPAEGSIVSSVPMQAVLQFNSRVDGPHCMLSLVAPDGKVTPLALAAQPAVNAIAAHLSALAPGAYALRWQALASDGHLTRGEVHFRVR